MKYICQTDYPHIPYVHTKESNGVPGHLKTVATSGCGLCTVAMIVDLLTTQTLDPAEAVEMAIACNANHDTGTDMALFGPMAAEKFGLTYEATEDLSKAIAHLQAGGMIAALVAGDGEDRVGLFTRRGHFIALIGVADGEFCILDPSYSDTKFTIPGREGKVRTEFAPYLYCKAAVVDEETKTYYLFARKK